MLPTLRSHTCGAKVNFMTLLTGQHKYKYWYYCISVFWVSVLVHYKSMTQIYHQHGSSTMKSGISIIKTLLPSQFDCLTKSLTWENFIFKLIKLRMLSRKKKHMFLSRHFSQPIAIIHLLIDCSKFRKSLFCFCIALTVCIIHNFCLQYSRHK